ncbi:MAG: UPF0489 family protein [Clostridioides sp.]|nr:UPF0489 family protein [Clostridioides sp.]
MDKYVGFYIEKPLGNNVFSYEKRKNKRIYVAKLIKGDLDCLEVGDKIAFDEVLEEEVEVESTKEKEIACFGLKNFVEYNLNEKKIYIFDNHNHAFYFWNKGLAENMFTKGCKLVHVDQHKDTRQPNDYNVNIDNLEDVFRYTNEVLNVGSFIQPAMKYNIFSELFIIDSTYTFSKIQEIKGEFVLDIDMDIFSKDMDYIDYGYKMESIRYLIKKAKFITIATSPFFIEQNYAIKVLKEILICDTM